MCAYERQPPFDDLVRGSNSLFGIVSALTERSVDVLETWLDDNPDLKVRFVLMVYPACATRQADLSRLLQLVERMADRLAVHVRPLERATERAMNALCVLRLASDTAHMVTGPSEDLGLEPCQDGQVNLVFRADPTLVEAFKRYFDRLWVNARDITAKGTTLIPDLAGC
jgi:hypothetical protein